MKCNFHTGCSLAKTARAATDDQLVAWLALADVGPDSGVAPKDATEHKSRWSLVQQSQGPTASSSSSAAAEDGANCAQSHAL